jgi:hypothetical protein
VTSEEQLILDRILKIAPREEREGFAALSDGEKASVAKMLIEYAKEGESGLLKRVWEADFETAPVSIEEFLESEYFVGKHIKENLYDRWKQELTDIIRGQKCEVILSGARGIGKSYAAIVLLLYKMHCLLCMKDPCAYYRANSLVFGLFAVTLNLAKTVEYQMLMGRIRESEYFSSIAGIQDLDDNKKPTSAILYFPKRIKFVVGSRAVHALGTDIIAAIMDEVNFSTSVDNLQIIEMYNAIVNGITSRFVDTRGRSAGILVLISSARNEGDFLDKHIQSVRGREYVHPVSLALYDVKKYDSPPFRVQVGDKFRSSKVLDKVFREDGKLTVIPQDPPDEAARVISVPAVFYDRYIDDLEKSLRDISGLALFATSLFIPQRDRIYECVEQDRSHPFAVKEPFLSIHDDEMTLESIFQKDKLFVLVDRFRNVYRCKLNPATPRYVHVDLGLRHDATGIACCHLCGVREIIRHDIDNKPIKTIAPVVYYDFMLRIKPPQGGEIDIGKIRSFLFMLIQMGFPVEEITFDQFASPEIIQTFIKSNVNARVLSVDRKPDAYMALKSAILENRANYYNYEPFLEEVVSLQFDRQKNKVDHPPDGSKDVSDAAAGAFFACITSEYAQTFLSDPGFIAGISVMEEYKKMKNDKGNKMWPVDDYPDIDSVTAIINDNIW